MQTYKVRLDKHATLVPVYYSSLVGKIINERRLTGLRFVCRCISLFQPDVTQEQLLRLAILTIARAVPLKRNA